MEKDIHELLVLEIKKHECIYNTNIVDNLQSQRTSCKIAWNQVAAKINLSVGDCMEKWRNIRSTYLRSLRPPPFGSKPKKPYYLSPYLEFVRPFMKPIRSSSSVVDISNEKKIKETSSSDKKCEETQNLESDEEESGMSLVSYESQNETEVEEDVNQKVFEPKNLRKRTWSEMKQNSNNNFEPKQTSKAVFPDENKSMKLFLLSLLPEFNSMSEQQMRNFKINVLQLINNLKDPSAESQPPLKPVDAISKNESRVSREKESTENLSPANKQCVSTAAEIVKNEMATEKKPSWTKNDALKSAKQLEAFALSHENYRLIGLSERIHEALEDLE